MQSWSRLLTQAGQEATSDTTHADLSSKYSLLLVVFLYSLTELVERKKKKKKNFQVTQVVVSMLTAEYLLSVSL